MLNPPRTHSRSVARGTIPGKSEPWGEIFGISLVHCGVSRSTLQNHSGWRIGIEIGQEILRVFDGRLKFVAQAQVEGYPRCNTQQSS